jgi:heme/copper-type cytochrome/quinol oxidase subunit 4
MKPDENWSWETLSIIFVLAILAVIIQGIIQRGKRLK